MKPEQLIVQIKLSETEPFAGLITLLHENYNQLPSDVQEYIAMNFKGDEDE